MRKVFSSGNTTMKSLGVIGFICTLLALMSANSHGETAAERGYRFLTQKAYLPPDFDQETFDQTWRVWPSELKARAESATPEERRKLAFSRYGLTGRPEDPTKPLQYVVDEAGNWTMNCFSCHGGKVLGETVLGVPNSRYALETLTSDIRKTKLITRKPMTRMDMGSLVVPLGKTNGTTNAVMFGVALLNYRDAELNIHPGRPMPEMVHHDMDAPAWWQFSKKSHLYIDAFAEKGHRALMQFMLVQENGREQFDEWESDFRDVYAFLDSLEAPDYPFEIDQQKATRGELVFNDNCAHCHGTYGDKPSYPNRLVPLEEVGTDDVRLTALKKEGREHYHKSWFAHFGEHDTVVDPKGYIAPPLDGVWASAPYFHNGSVPTLWHVLHSEDRPKVWTRSEDGFDQKRVGLQIQEFEKLPSSIRRPDVLRMHFNTSSFGKSAGGHTFPDDLTTDERVDLLEYLKTL